MGMCVAVLIVGWQGVCSRGFVHLPDVILVAHPVQQELHREGARNAAELMFLEGPAKAVAKATAQIRP
jgi:hypothetical protein